jgi:hypothetical protein
LDGNIRQGVVWCFGKNCSEGQENEVNEVGEVKEVKEVKERRLTGAAERGAARSGEER